MSPYRRTVALAAAVLLPGLLLAGCGGTSEEEPTSYLLTDLEGGTAAPDTFETPPGTGSAESVTPDGSGTPTGEELVARVGAAMGGFDTVRVSIGNANPPPVVEMDLDYGAGDLGLELTPVAEGDPVLDVRRIDGTVYVDAGAGVEAVEADDPRLSTTTSIFPAVFAFDLLADLRATLDEGRDLEDLGDADIDGAEVEQYRLSLDADALIQPSLLAQSGGRIDVIVSLDPDGLPRRIDYDIEPGTISRLDFSGWGDDVDLAVPELG